MVLVWIRDLWSRNLERHGLGRSAYFKNLGFMWGGSQARLKPRLPASTVLGGSWDLVSTYN